MIETAKACTVAFMKARNSLVVRCREREKKAEDVENVFFFKAFVNRFWLTSKSCSWFNKVVHSRLPSNGLHEKVTKSNICY